jgi:hypothetical protein
MAHFSQVVDNIVTEVIVIDDNDAPDEAIGQAFISDVLGKSGLWLKTSYNSHAGKHYVSNYYPLSGNPHYRFNFGAPGYTYDASLDAFIPPKPEGNFVLDETQCIWVEETPAP